MSAKEPTKAVIQNLDTGEKIVAMYNPTEYTSTRQMVTSDQSVGVQFQRVDEPNFSVHLFFDTYEQGTDVRALTNRIAALQNPSEGTGEKRSPPKCMFSWGGFRYTGLLTQVTQKFTLFLDSGVPVRAELDLTFSNTPTPRQVLEDAGLDNCRKLCVVKASDRLDVLAYNQAGTAARWRAIASANDIVDPQLFPTASDVGRTLIVPDFHGKGAR